MTTAAPEVASERPGRLIRTDRTAWIIVGAAFVLSRIGYWLAGVRFDTAPIDYLPQLLDRGLLRHDLFESVWYLHAQPPLFNLFVGSVLHFPGISSGVFTIIYLAAGLLLVLGLYDLGRQLTLGRGVSIAVAVVVGCGPTVVLYGSNVNYDALVMTMVVLILDACARWVRNGHTSALVAIVGLAAAATLTRSLFHPIWFLSIVVLAVVLRRPAWGWKPAVVIAIPVLLVAGAIVKNEVIFGTPQLSTWFGFNLYRSTVQSLPPDQPSHLHERGVITARVLRGPCRVQHRDVPALAERWKRSGDPNGNYECGIKNNEELADDAFSAMKAEPVWVAKGVFSSFELWPMPSTLYFDVRPARREVSGLDTFYRRTVLLDVPWTPPIRIVNADFVALQAPDHRFHISLTIVFTTLLSIAGAFVVLAQWRRRGMTPARAAMLVGGWTILFVTLSGNLFEHGENNRFRVVVEPITLLLAVAVVVGIIRVIQARRAT